jgi:hypothetical protein
VPISELAQTYFVLVLEILQLNLHLISELNF